MKSDEAFARAEMFRESADHLDGDITFDRDEKKQIPYVQKVIRGYADRWMKKYNQLKKKENA